MRSVLSASLKAGRGVSNLKASGSINVLRMLSVWVVVIVRLESQEVSVSRLGPNGKLHTNYVILLYNVNTNLNC